MVGTRTISIDEAAEVCGISRSSAYRAKGRPVTNNTAGTTVAGADTCTRAYAGVGQWLRARRCGGARIVAYRIQPYQKYTPTPDLFLTRVLNEEEYSVAGFTGLVIRKTLGHVNRANPKERKWIAPIARSQFKTEMGVAPCSFRVGRRRAVAQGYVIEEQPADEAKMRGAEYSIGIPLVVRGIRDRLRQLHVR